MICPGCGLLCRYEEDEERQERFQYTMLGGVTVLPVALRNARGLLYCMSDKS